MSDNITSAGAYVDYIDITGEYRDTSAGVYLDYLELTTIYEITSVGIMLDIANDPARIISRFGPTLWIM